jgi:hypothetical protein
VYVSVCVCVWTIPSVQEACGVGQRCMELLEGRSVCVYGCMCVCVYVYKERERERTTSLHESCCVGHRCMEVA